MSDSEEVSDVESHHSDAASSDAGSGGGSVRRDSGSEKKSDDEGSGSDNESNDEGSVRRGSNSEKGSDAESDAESGKGSDDEGSGKGSDAEGSGKDSDAEGSGKGTDDEEIDSEEAEDEDEDRRPRKKKRKAGVLNFLLDEAMVDEDTDGESGSEEEGFEELVSSRKHQERERGPDARDIDGKRRLNEMWDLEDSEQIEKYYTEKYRSQSAGERYGEGEEMSDDIAQQGLLPGVKDPNLWVIKCRQGEEKATALQLMRKFIAYQYTGDSLQIKSVVVKEGLKGYIYVEAYKQTHVKQAIEAVGNLRIGQWQQQMVPIKEMTDVLRVVNEMAYLKKGQWIRLRRGIFRDDIAKVDFVEPAQNIVHVKLIPRVDYARKRGALRTQNVDAKKKKVPTATLR